MNEGQEIDFAYHEAKLRRLIAQRQALPANSAEVMNLNEELKWVEELVRSYQLLKAYGR